MGRVGRKNHGKSAVRILIFSPVPSVIISGAKRVSEDKPLEMRMQMCFRFLNRNKGVCPIPLAGKRLELKRL